MERIVLQRRANAINTRQSCCVFCGNPSPPTFSLRDVQVGMEWNPRIESLYETFTMTHEPLFLSLSWYRVHDKFDTLIPRDVLITEATNSPLLVH